MTAPAGSTAPDAEDRSVVAEVRREGRALVIAIHAAARAMRLYPAEHQATRRALQELAATAEAIRDTTGEVDLRAQGRVFFLNGTRLRSDFSAYESFGRVQDAWRGAGVGAVQIRPHRSARDADWQALLAALVAAPEGGADALAAVRARLDAAGCRAFELSPPASEPAVQDARQSAKRTYAESVALTRDVFDSHRLGRAPSARRLKRAVQLIIDQVLTEETSLVGLTALRGYDEYTYTHSVNVCIFSVALGKRLGLEKIELYELGLAALLHDMGKSRIPLSILHKTTQLDDAEWRVVVQHPWQGMLALFALRGQRELPYRAIVAAHEHHMKCDLSGYPRPRRPRHLGLVSRIIAVADGYDAGTSRRTYQTVPLSPSAVLQEMRDNAARGLDPVIVKAFINLLGIYPPGSLVVLDTGELAVVEAANPDPTLLTRPAVVLVSTASGRRLEEPVRADLAARGRAGEFARTIVRTIDPAPYGIRVSDYLV